jgi:putative endonuclease
MSSSGLSRGSIDPHTLWMPSSTSHIYWTYILASAPRGTLYVGVTNNILGRTEQHRVGEGSTFTSRYGVRLLVYYEMFGDVDEAIQREKSIKRYVRAWKVNLIERDNPQWQDLYPDLKRRFG